MPSSTVIKLGPAIWQLPRLSTLGDTRDPAHRISPYLTEWESLPQDIKDRDRQAIRAIPELLASVGLGIRRSGKPCRRNDQSERGWG